MGYRGRGSEERVVGSFPNASISQFHFVPKGVEGVGTSAGRCCLSGRKGVGGGKLPHPQGGGKLAGSQGRPLAHAGQAVQHPTGIKTSWLDVRNWPESHFTTAETSVGRTLPHAYNFSLTQKKSVLQPFFQLHPQSCFSGGERVLGRIVGILLQWSRHSSVPRSIVVLICQIILFLSLIPPADR